MTCLLSSIAVEIEVKLMLIDTTAEAFIVHECGLMALEAGEKH